VEILGASEANDEKVCKSYARKNLFFEYLIKSAKEE